MGLFDPLLNALALALESIDDAIETITNPSIDGDQLSEEAAEDIENIGPFGELFAFAIDIVEEFVVADLAEKGQLKPENVEDTVDGVEGNAGAVLGLLGATNSIIETLSLGQIDSQSEFLIEAVTALGVADVTGAELEARVREGVEPAMNAKAAKEHRSKFVDLADAVEFALRKKETDDQFLSGLNAPPEVVSAIGSNVPVNEDNILEEWGIRDDQLGILEEVALNDMEFEELIETPAELGLIVPDEVINAELDRSGYSEQTKDFLAKVNNRIPLSARAYKELIVSEDHIADLDVRVEDGTLTPAEAGALVPDAVPADQGELLQRWNQKDDLTPKAPTQADYSDALVEGYVDLDETRDRLEQSELDTERYTGVLKAEIVGDLDGSLQEALATGRLSERDFANLGEFAELDDNAIDSLLAGKSFADITKQRLSAEREPQAASVETIVGIGESRSQALEAAGIPTVADLAGATSELVTEAAGVSEEVAEEFIGRARQRI